MRPEIKPILEELKREFEAIYGDRLVKMILFGSQARGDADDGSDVDVLVVLRGPVNDWEEGDRTSEATARVCLRHDVLVERFFVSDEEYAAAPVSLLRNVQREGVAL